MSSPPSPPADSLRVLVYEDNQMDAILVRRFLQANGVQHANILTTDHLPNAVDMLTRENIDLCLTDYYLSPNTGFDLMDEARRREIDVPFIVMTAMDDPSLDDGALSRGAYDFIVKGDMTVEGLERTIRYTLARHKRESYLAKTANYDLLSNLHSRSAMMDRLSVLLETPPDKGTALGAMVYVNLNGLKFINDAYGIKVGDAILRETGRRLKTLKWPGETMARLGSDEFACVAEQVPDHGQAMVTARRIATAFSQPVRTFDGEHDISAAIGVITFPRGKGESLTSVDVLQLASETMQEAKLTCRITRATEIASKRKH